MPKKKLTAAEKIAQIPIEEIGRLSGEEGAKTQRKYLKTLVMGYKRRVASFKRKGIFSYAQEAYEGYNFVLDTKNINKLNYHQRVMEIAKLQHFFNAKTSSAKGIKEVEKEQDARIFGTDKRGRPLQRMDNVTRRLFWKLYDEYLIQNPTRYPQSETVQQNLASIIFSAAEIDPDEDVAQDEMMSFVNVLQKLEEKMINKDISKQGEPNVYMGRGPTFD